MSVFSSRERMVPGLGRGLGWVLVGLLSAGGADAAADTQDWYATGSLGFTTQSDQNLTYTGPGVGGEVSRKLPLDNGFLAGGAIGRHLDEVWRVEAEFMYQSVDHPRFTLGAGGPSGDGNYASTSIALNLVREFDLLGSPHTRTYVGVGAVYATEVDVDFESNGVERSFSGSDGGVQLLFGARYSLGERSFVDAGVRYLLVSGVDLEEEQNGTGRIKADYEPIAVTVAFGWRF